MEQTWLIEMQFATSSKRIRNKCRSKLINLLFHKQSDRTWMKQKLQKEIICKKMEQAHKNKNGGT
jgi:hypothetical protein